MSASGRSTNPSRRATDVSRVLAVVALLTTVIGQNAGRALGDPADALPYSLSYTVTGDFAIGGVDLLPQSHANGFQTGTINMGTAATRVVPKNAEILAAFLYWETLAETPDDLGGVRFRGQPVSFVRTLEQELTGVFAPCWSRSGNTLYSMRADVLSLLPAQLDEAGNPTGRRLVNNADLIAAGEDAAHGHAPGTRRRQPDTAERRCQLVHRLPRHRSDHAAPAHRRLRRRPRAGQGRDDDAEDPRLPAVGGRCRTRPADHQPRRREPHRRDDGHRRGRDDHRQQPLRRVAEPRFGSQLGQSRHHGYADDAGRQWGRLRRTAHPDVALHQPGDLRLPDVGGHRVQHAGRGCRLRRADRRAGDRAGGRLSVDGSERGGLSQAVGNGCGPRQEGCVRRDQQHGRRPGHNLRLADPPVSAAGPGCRRRRHRQRRP